MAKAFSIVALVIFLTSLSAVQVFCVRTAEFRAARSKYSPKYFHNFTIKARNSSIFLDLYTKKVLLTGFKTYLDFQLRLSSSNKFQSLFSYHVDVCNIVTSLKDTLFKKWFRSVLKYGNFMENCPVDVGHYYLNGWTIESNMVPSYMYPGDYRIRGRGYYGKYKSPEEDFVIDCECDVTIK